MAELEKDVIKFDLEVKEYFKGKMTKPQEIERKTKEIIVKEKRVRFNKKDILNVKCGRALLWENEEVWANHFIYFFHVLVKLIAC